MQTYPDLISILAIIHLAIICLQLRAQAMKRLADLEETERQLNAKRQSIKDAILLALERELQERRDRLELNIISAEQSPNDKEQLTHHLSILQASDDFSCNFCNKESRVAEDSRVSFG